jgi:hypothetical protein
MSFRLGYSDLKFQFDDIPILLPRPHGPPRLVLHSKLQFLGNWSLPRLVLVAVCTISDIRLFVPSIDHSNRYLLGSS